RASGVVGNDHCRATDIVRIIGFRELMAQTRERILDTRTVALSVGRIRWVNLDLDGVDPWRNNRLTITAIEHEVLPAQLEDIGIRPPCAYPLEAVACEGAAAAVRPRAVPIVHVERIGVEHAEAAFCRLPDMAVGPDQLVGCVMLKVEMLMARGELEQPVGIGKIAVPVRIHVLERATDENVTLADVGRGDREPD